jgi:hypothetical protein
MSRTVPITHPTWCARAHYCTATSASRNLPARGEHRSQPMRIDTTWGGLVATLVASHTGRPYLELRMSVHIPAQETRARLRADLISRELARAVDLALVEADVAYLLATQPDLRLAIEANHQEVTR